MNGTIAPCALWWTRLLIVFRNAGCSATASLAAERQLHIQRGSEPHARPMDFTRRPMRGYVYVDPPGYDSDAELRGWLDRGLAYARSLPAKD